MRKENKPGAFGKSGSQLHSGQFLSNPNQIRGWERDLQTDPEDTEVEAEILDFIHDPGNTRGRLSVFN